MFTRPRQLLAVMLSAVLVLLGGITSPALAQGSTETINVYLVAIGDDGQSGQRFGCDDSLVPLEVEIEQTGKIEDRIAATLGALFALEDDDFAGTGLYNSLRQSDLMVDNVTVTDGMALVEISGDRLLGGTCDDPRFEFQIEQTVLQFDEIEGVTVLFEGGWLVPDARGAMCFNEVEHCIQNDFLTFWENNGGLPVFGFPMSDLVIEHGRVVQYFERQRFELHPENGAPYTILLGRLGHQAADERGLLGDAAFQPVSAGQHPDECIFFEETGHRVCWGFRAYWQIHGLDMGDDGASFRESLALFGYPISEEFTDPESGLVTQYFERAIFQWQPENDPPWDILLERLGAELIE